MKRIRLRDNTNERSISREEYEGCEDELIYLSSQTIANLKDSKGRSVLIFPHSIKHAEDLDENQKIINVNYALSDGRKVVRSIETGNLMGFIGLNGLEINISSRFVENDREDYFLHYMLQKVMNINVFNFEHVARKDDMFDLLPFMFPYYLKKALRQGIFRQYVTHRHDDANVRGVINVARHLRKNMPFNFSISYDTRDYDADNSLIQLIRHTIEYIRKKKYGNSILYADSDTISAVAQFVSLTPSFNVRQQDSIINENRRPFRHPYYTEYNALQKLCLQILRHEKVKYSENKDKVNGILFDGAWLWEEYVATLLAKLYFVHPRNKKGEGRIYLCEGKYPRYPDFYYGGMSNSYILDAKYKRDIDSRDDVNQILAYMYRLSGRGCGFVLPKKYDEEKETFTLRKLLGDYGKNLTEYRITIPHGLTSYEEFKEKMEVHEQSFLNILNQRLQRY